MFFKKINKAGIELIKEFEGLRLKAYLCPSKILTIGYGHTITTQKDMVITKEEAEDLLKKDLEYFERKVSMLVKVPLNENEFSSLISFAFNVGIGNFENSTLLRLLNRGWYEQVPTQLMRWNKSNGQELGGLSRRRSAEAILWNTRV